MVNTFLFKLHLLRHQPAFQSAHSFAWMLSIPRRVTSPSTPFPLQSAHSLAGSPIPRIESKCLMIGLHNKIVLQIISGVAPLVTILIMMVMQVSTIDVHWSAIASGKRPQSFFMASLIFSLWSSNILCIMETANLHIMQIWSFPLTIRPIN